MYRRRQRWSRSYSYRSPRTRYSNETMNSTNQLSFTGTSTTNIDPIVLVPSISQQGVRKTKNYTLSLYCSQIGNNTTPLQFVLVYVPEGTKPSALSIGANDATTSLYEPNQNVILQGSILAGGSLVQRFTTRLSRNLNSGDSIQLIIQNPSGISGQATLQTQLNYSIAY